MKLKSYPKMKDSGVEWIGEIPEHWEIRKLSHLVHVTKLAGFEYTQYFEYQESGDVGIIKAQNVNMGKFVTDKLQYVPQSTSNNLPRSQIHGNEILMVFIGNVGNVCLSPSNGKWHLGPNVAKLTPKKDSREFICHFLQSESGLTNSKLAVNNAVQPNFSLATIRTFLIAHPPIEEQILISKFLDPIKKKIDFKIEENKKLIVLLREKYKVLINELVTKGLDPSVQMKDSGIEGIGEIPESWKVKKIKSITKCLDGRRIPLNGVERSSMSGDIPYYGASGMVDNINDYIFDEKLVCFSEDGDNLRSRILPIAFMIEGKSWVNNHAHVLRPTQINENFLVYLLNSLDLIPYLEGATRVKLNQSTMNSIPLPYPPSNEQKQISEYLDKEIIKITELLTKLNSKIEKLEEYYKSLMYSIVTGKIDLSELN